MESAYGGPDAMKGLVRQAHGLGLAVIQDVVYNHFGQSDLNLWQFDSWQERGLGGIYFYNGCPRRSIPATQPAGTAERPRRHHDRAVQLVDLHLAGLKNRARPPRLTG